MVKLLLTIQAHPARVDMLHNLMASLDLKATTLWSVVMDAERVGVWPTMARALAIPFAGVTHRLHLHEDVLPCRDFLAGVERAIEARPDVPLSFFGTRKVMEEARARGSSWALVYSPLMSQAFCFPDALAQDMVRWVERCIDPDKLESRWDDSRIAAYLLAHGIPMWYTAPSLVEHVGYDRSMIGIRGTVAGRPRTAKWFHGYGNSALDIDWSRGLDNPPIDRSGGLGRYRPYLREGVL